MRLHIIPINPVAGGEDETQIEPRFGQAYRSRRTVENKRPGRIALNAVALGVQNSEVVLSQPITARGRTPAKSASPPPVRLTKAEQEQAKIARIKAQNAILRKQMASERRAAQAL